MAAGKSPARSAALKKAPARKAAPAKKAPARKPAAKKAAPKKQPAAKRKPNAAFMKPLTSSAELAALLGDKAMPTTEITKKIWDYIKRNKLQDTANQRTVLPATVAPRSLTQAQIELMVKSSLVKSLK